VKSRSFSNGNSDRLDTVYVAVRKRQTPKNIAVYPNGSGLKPGVQMLSEVIFDVAE
jgi:hypothetical protein